MNDWKGILRTTRRYQDDGAPDMEYGKALALPALGEEDKAEHCLRKAINNHPNVAKELLKARHARPKSHIPGTISRGGADEAFDYWQRNKTHWAKDTRAYALLKELERA